MGSVICSIIVLGLSGMIAQIVLLRELLIVFSGNEIFLGVYIALWVAGEALGAVVAEKTRNTATDAVVRFAGMTFCFVLLFIAAILFARQWKPLLGIPVEVASGIWAVLGVSAVVLLSVSIVHGFLFISACGIMGQESLRGDNAVGFTYSWETIGSIVGGILASFVLVVYLNSIDIALILAFVNSMACAYLFAGRCGIGLLPWVSALLCCLLSIAAFFSDYGDLVHKESISRQWGGRNIVSYRNSPYQNITVIESGAQYTLFSDGVPQLVLPVPDIEYVEELSHLPLLLHPNPCDLLVIGGGAGGLIAEMLKYPSIRSIDYLEPDPVLLNTIRELPAVISAGELTNSKVSLINEDGRVYLQKTGKRYDVVILNMPLPETLQSNRFFTRQFFTRIKVVLRDNGLLALPSKGSLTYYSGELRLLNASLLATLEDVFARVVIIPGDTNIFVAGKTAFAGPDASLMSKRQMERMIESRLLSPEYLAFRLAQEGRDAVKSELAQASTPRMNNDFSPSLMYCTLAYKALAHSKVLSAILGGAQRLNIALAVAISLSVVLLSGIFVGNDRRTAIVLTVAGTGMTSMIGELLLMTVFQVFYGSLFHLVGMLLTLFMAGVAAGSYLATSQKVRECSGARIMVCLECSFIALLLGQVLFVAMLEQGFLEAIRLPVLLGSIIVTGVFTGMTYPVASRLYQHIDNINVASDRLKGTGVIYAVDLLGGGIGGIVGGIIFIPLLGVQGSFLALVLLKTATFLLFIKAWGAGSGWLRCEY